MSISYILSDNPNKKNSGKSLKNTQICLHFFPSPNTDPQTLILEKGGDVCSILIFCFVLPLSLSGIVVVKAVYA